MVRTSDEETFQKPIGVLGFCAGWISSSLRGIPIEAAHKRIRLEVSECKFPLSPLNPNNRGSSYSEDANHIPDPNL